MVEILAAAANLHPSAEEATQFHGYSGTLFDVQLAPELVEVKIEPIIGFTATSLFPSADEATQVQPPLVGALVSVQVWAETRLAVSKAVETTSRILKIFIGRLMNLLHSTIL